jgi:NAD(P)-dependent dehydrogenase (short-subunit alcohol dehydrogenase family)
VRGLSEALDVEYAQHGVSVACVMPWFVETPILNAGASQGTNENMADALRKGGLEVYPVEDAAQVVWEAAHGKELHYFVGKRAKQMRFASQLHAGRRQEAAPLPAPTVVLRPSSGARSDETVRFGDVAGRRGLGRGRGDRGRGRLGDRADRAAHAARAVEA